MHLLVFSLLLAAAARSGKRGENWKSCVHAELWPSSPDSSVAAVSSQDFPEQWDDDTALDAYFDDLREDKAWPAGLVEYVGLVVEDQNMLTPPAPNAVGEGERCCGGPSTHWQSLTAFCSVRS